jgi:hypothetical protein
MAKSTFQGDHFNAEKGSDLFFKALRDTLDRPLSTQIINKKAKNANFFVIPSGEPDPIF